MANSIKIGGNSASKFYVGSTEVDKIYLGNTEIYKKAASAPDKYTINKYSYGELVMTLKKELPYSIAENGVVIYKIEKDTDETIRETYKQETDKTVRMLSMGQETTMIANGSRNRGT